MIVRAKAWHLGQDEDKAMWHKIGEIKKKKKENMNEANKEEK